MHKTKILYRINLLVTFIRLTRQNLGQWPHLRWKLVEPSEEISMILAPPSKVPPARNSEYLDKLKIFSTEKKNNNITQTLSTKEPFENAFRKLPISSHKSTHGKTQFQRSCRLNAYCSNKTEVEAGPEFYYDMYFHAFVI